MFDKGVCEEIIDDKNIKLVFSNEILNSYFKANINNKHIKMPKCYFDRTSNNRSKLSSEYNLRYIIHRLHDCINNQTFYFISLFSRNLKNYDSDFIQFIKDASKCPKYHYDVFYTTNVYKRSFELTTEIIFIIDLESPISMEYLMSRDYRIDLNLMDKVSLLADYKEELNTVDQEG